MKVYDKHSLNEYHQSLTYDDISLIPTNVSRVKSRKEVDTSSKFLGLNLALPLVSSPMESVTGIEMAIELYSLGCLAIVNRFDSSLDEILNNNNENQCDISCIKYSTKHNKETSRRKKSNLH